MRTRLWYSILVAMISSFLFVACDSADSTDTADPPPSGGAASVSTDEVDFAVKAVDSSLSSIPDVVFKSLNVSDAGDPDVKQLPDSLAGTGLPEDGVVYEGDGIKITLEGVSTEPPGLILGFAFDEFNPAPGGEETLSGSMTLLVGVDLDLLDPRIVMTLNTEAGSDLTVSGGQIDGMTLGFEDFTLFFSMSQVALEPVGVEGTLFINGTAVGLDMLEAQLPTLPGFAGDGVSPEALQLAVQALVSSLDLFAPGGVLPDFFGTLNPADLLSAVSQGEGALPAFLSGDGLPENGVIHAGDGITITIEGISTEPLGLVLGFAFDEFLIVEGGEETLSGALTLLAGVDMGVTGERILMILNSEAGSPLTVSGGTLDGMTLGFDEFTFYFSLSEGAIDPVGVEGTLLVNGTPVGLDQLEGVVPALLGGPSAGVTQGALQAAVQTLTSSVNGNTMGDLPTLLGGVASGVPLPALLSGAGLPTDGVIYSDGGLTVTIEGISTSPLGLILGFAFDEFSPVEGGEETVSGQFTLLAGVEVGLLGSKIVVILNSEADTPLTINGGQLGGTTLGFEDLTLFFSLSQLALSPAGVEGTLLINGFAVDLDMVGALLGGL